MSSIHFRSGEIDLQLRGSESFLLRQLLLFAPALGRVDSRALQVPAAAAPPPETPVQALPPEAKEPATAIPTPLAATSEPAAPVATAAFSVAPPPAEAVAAVPRNGDTTHTPEDDLASFYRSFVPMDRDRQVDAALLFAYYLQRKQGFAEVNIADLLRACIRAGVDSRNFHRALGVLTRRGLLEELSQGKRYRISEQGVGAVEERMS